MKNADDGIRVVDVTDPPSLPAGEFSAWVESFRRGLADGSGSEVPCGTCNACCRSSLFIHVEPDETETLAHIPRALLFPAPGRPGGHLVLGYDRNGRCPMLIDEQCSIYQHRPRACRTYDCRVYPAAGIDAGDGGARAPITRQARGWSFAYPNEADQRQHAAVRAAAAFIEEHRECLATGTADNATALALLAIKASRVFLGADDAEPAPTDAELVEAVKNSIR